MFFNLVVVVFLSVATLSSSQEFNFTFNGFQSANLTLDGTAKITSNGALELTNGSKESLGHAFYPFPVHFKSSDDVVSSFSSLFIFALRKLHQGVDSQGIAFVVSPTRGLDGAAHSEYMGLFNVSNSGNKTNHVFAVELDTSQTKKFDDINDNHVGIDINGLNSMNSTSAGYVSDKDGEFQNLSLTTGKPMEVWVNYNASTTRIEVRLAPISFGKPRKPTVSVNYNLSKVLRGTMYIGFASAKGTAPCLNYILGWSFKMNGEAEPLSLKQIPKLPPRLQHKSVLTGSYRIVLPLILLGLILALVLIICVIRRKRKFAEELEDWELDFGLHRFGFRDLYQATKGFKDTNLLGKGGFGRVYRGVLTHLKTELAVKRFSQESKQGMREFMAEIESIGRMSHRNLVPLLGYCRRRGEFILVYSYMPNGSLDKYIYGGPGVILNWHQRFNIVKGVASGLFYLHEEWEQVVVHRDVKASNVMLDGEWNGRLGDFGLARSYCRGSNPDTTRVAGTPGYIAPELSRTGRATTSTDVFAFGVFLLEVACWRRPVETWRGDEDSVWLVDWVSGFWLRGDILGAKDPNLGSDFNEEEVELVLKLGLLCSRPDPKARPSMGQALHYLHRDLPLPELPPMDVSTSGSLFSNKQEFSSVSLSSITESTF